MKLYSRARNSIRGTEIKFVTLIFVSLHDLGVFCISDLEEYTCLFFTIYHVLSIVVE
jgi:hypothetical protein